MSLILFILMVATCLLFLFTLRIILGAFLLREDKVAITRSEIQYVKFNFVFLGYLTSCYVKASIINLIGR